MFDTHLHYNIDPLWTNWQSFLNEAQQQGVHSSIVVGFDLASSEQACAIAKQTDRVYAAVGLHPRDAQVENMHEAIQQVRVLVKSSDKIVAIGECGLDFYHLRAEQRTQSLPFQRELFEQQLDLALEMNLPVSVHSRDAEDVMLQVLSARFHTQTLPQIVLHCVSGSVAYIRSALKMGAYISFAGNVTYKNAENVRELARITPLERVLIETDAPFLSPEPVRGQHPNHPAYIRHTAEFLAKNLYHVSFEEFESATDANATSVFLGRKS